MKDNIMFVVRSVVFLVTFVSISSVKAKAAECIPDSPYLNCGEQSAYGAYAKLQSTAMAYYSFEGKRYLLDSKIEVKCDGDKLYLYDGDKSDQCSSDGCHNAITTIQTGTDATYDFADFKEGIQPQLVCWDKSSSGWLYVSRTWPSTYYPQTHECSSDSGCGADEYCNDSNPYEVTCSKLNCNENARIINHICVPYSMNYVLSLLLGKEE